MVHAPTAPLTPKDVFAALANDTRLRCLMLLRRHRELCVCELTRAIGVSQPHVSRHLALLRELGLVSDRRRGTWVHYRIDPTLPGWIQQVLAETARATADAPPFRDDARAIDTMPNRPSTMRCA